MTHPDRRVYEPCGEAVVGRSPTFPATAGLPGSSSPRSSPGWRRRWPSMTWCARGGGTRAGAVFVSLWPREGEER